MLGPAQGRIPLRLGLLAALILAFALRLPVGGVPPGLYRDEAYYGLDAVNVLAGQPALYFPANNGREPLFIYLAAAFVSFLGATPAALRLASAFVGVATVAATFTAGRSLLGARAGLLGAWLCAVTPWPVLLARAGYRAGTLPLVLALAVAATAWAWRCSAGGWALGGGTLTGLTLYTYAAGRLAPLVVAVTLPGAIWAGARPSRRLVGHWLGAAALAAAPLLAWWAFHPDMVFQRLGEVAIWRGHPVGGAPGSLAGNLAATLGMLQVRGDFIPRHNIPWRPVFGWAAGTLALLGLVAALAAARRRRTGGVIVLAWLALMALPTTLAEGAPHFLRAVGLLPAAMLLPALGAEGLAALVARRRARLATLLWALVAAGAVLGEARATLRYLGQPVTADSDLFYQFEGGVLDLARTVNTVRGAGWRGGWAEGPSGPGQPVWVDRRLRDGWPSLQYLVPDRSVILADPKDPVLTRLPGRAYLLPDALRLDELWAGLAPNVRLEFRPGSLARGDLEAEARRLYVEVTGRPAGPTTSPVARFANNLTLLSAEAHPTADGRALEVTTVWSAEGPTPRDVTAFFQVLDRGARVAGDDTVLGSGLYPSPRWRPGDQVVERRRLTLPQPFDPSRHQLVAGTYVAPDTTPIPVVGADGRDLGGHVALPVEPRAAGN